MKSITEATKNKPCTHCGKPDWCYALANGSTVCNRGNIATGWGDSGKKDKNGAAILHPESWQGKIPKPKPIQTQEWLYNDRLGNPLVKVIRQDLDNGKKRIFQNYWNGSEWLNKKPASIERSEIPIYCYSEVLEAMEAGKPIFIVEGEKCADLLWRLGLAATTNIQGCKSFSRSDAEDLKDYPDIVLIPDRDRPGVQLMEKWAKALPQAKWLYPFPDKDWSDIPPDNGLDIFDWVRDRSLTAQDILEGIGKLPESKTVEVKTSTPLQEVRTETAQVYGGLKDLKTHELVDFVANNIAQDLEFDELRSEMLYKGKRLTLGTDCKIWFLRKFGESAGKEDIYDAFVSFAKDNAFNPVQRYLESVAAKPERVRIGNLAERYFGRSEPIYNRLVEMWLISAVARALNQGSDDNPGVQVDHTLILQSSQGKYKSTWFKVLGGAWFSDSVKDIESKDSLMIVHSNWIIELSELDRITSRKQAGAIKHWLTQKTDSYRKPYAREIEPNLPRPCVFCGTVNPSRFLVDDENRRFWIIPVSETLSEIDIPLVTQERDAIWASAYDAYQSGKRWWPDDEEKAAIALINDSFRDLDAWQEPIEEWIAHREYVSAYEILTELFKIEPGQIKRAEDMRVGKILNALGWTKESRRHYTDSNGEKVFRKVRLNPAFIEKVGKVGKVGKQGSTQGFQDYLPSPEVGNRSVKSDLPTLPTSNTDLTDPETQSEKAIYLPTDHYLQFPNSTPGWREKNGHKLAEEMWVIVPKLGACQLKQPLSNGWRVWARDAGGVMASVDFDSITHVWEV